MSQGGIYKGPGGEELHGDGRPVHTTPVHPSEPVYLDGVYAITPLGPTTTFECLIKRDGSLYVLIDLNTKEDLVVEPALLHKMRPQFKRQSTL